MTNWLKGIKTLSLLFSIILLTSCVPAVLVTTGVVGTTMVEERTAGDKLDDNIIKIKINEAFAQSDVNEMFAHINVNVYEGRVLLTGSVKNSTFVNKASELAGRVRNVKEVINELVVTDKNMTEGAKDIVIANSVRTKLMVEKDLRSLNYIVECNNGIVYLLGLAQNEAELSKAVNITSRIKGVKKVISHVVLKDDLRRQH